MGGNLVRYNSLHLNTYSADPYISPSWINLLEAIRERSKEGVCRQQEGRQEAGLGGRQWSGERHDGGREV